MPRNKACSNKWATYHEVCSCQHPSPLAFAWAEWLLLLNKICAFFGHRDTQVTNSLISKLQEILISLINQGVDEFWCCEQGEFDWIARSTMLDLKKKFSDIKVCYVLAYPTFLRSETSYNYLEETYDDIIYPDEAAEGHQKFAITRRNKYIVENADVIVCYIKRQSGGAFKAVKLAEKLNKGVINLANI